MGFFSARATACLPRFNKTFGQAVVYARGIEEISIDAIQENEERRDDPFNQAVVESGRCSFLMHAASLRPISLPPISGDRMTNAAGVEFEVLPHDGMPCWEWSDPDRLTLRVFCREIVGS